MVKKWFSMLLITVVITIIAGCGNNSGVNGSNINTEDANQNGDDQESITLTYMASQGWIKDAEMELAKKFEEETGIKIDYQIVPADQYFNVLKTKLNAGEGPDIFGGQSGFSEITMNYNVEKNAVDLSDEEWVNREDPLSLQQLSVDGKVYALTIADTYNSYVILYNKKIFQELNLEVPHTFEEFKQVSGTILEAGITPIYEPIADGWHHVLWFAEIGANFNKVDAGLYDDLNQNKKKFVDSEAMLEALTQLKELYDLGMFGDNTFSDAVADMVAKIGSGDFAMTLAKQNTAVQVVEEFEELNIEDIGFFPIPLADNQIDNINPGGPSKFIYSGSPYIEEAKRYFSFLTEQENLQLYLDNDSELSNLNFPGLETKYTAEQKEFNETYSERGVNMQSYVNYVNPQWMDIGKDIVAMLSGMIEPIDVLENIDQRREEMAKIAKDPNWE